MYTQRNIDKDNMRHIDHVNSYHNVFVRNATAIKKIEDALFNDLIPKIQRVKRLLKNDKSNEKLITEKYLLEAQYQHLSNEYCFANPFSETNISIN